MKREKQLEKLNREIRNCKKCNLWKLRKNYSQKKSSEYEIKIRYNLFF